MTAGSTTETVSSANCRDSCHHSRFGTVVPNTPAVSEWFLLTRMKQIGYSIARNSKSGCSIHAARYYGFMGNASGSLPLIPGTAFSTLAGIGKTVTA